MTEPLSALRKDCCAAWPKPCSYHEGWLDGFDSVSADCDRLRAERDGERAENAVRKEANAGLRQENRALRAALEDVRAIQNEYDRKPNVIPVAGWYAIRERLQHADVRLEVTR